MFVGNRRRLFTEGCTLGGTSVIANEKVDGDFGEFHANVIECENRD